MCSPTAVGYAVVIVGTAIKANANKQAAESANSASEYNAQIMEQRRDDLEVAAVDAEKRGNLSISKFRTQVNSLKADQRVGFASSGVKVGEGSAQDLADSTNIQASSDAMTLRYNAQQEAKGLRNEGAIAAQGANLSRMGKRDANAVRNLTLMSGLSSVAGRALASVKFGSSRKAKPFTAGPGIRTDSPRSLGRGLAHA